MKNDIIAIDGPAGAGKSTVSKKLAEKLSYTYIDTGAMYRSIAWKIQQSNISVDEYDKVTNMLSKVKIDFKNSRIFVDNQDISALIRTPQIGEMTSKVSANQYVRQKMLALQREICSEGKCVVEGRDIGTVVFPETPYKFYLDASVQIRAKRRYQELKNYDVDSDLEKIKKSIEERDKRDSERTFAPLKRAADAYYIHTDTYSIEEVVVLILNQIRHKEKDG